MLLSQIYVYTEEYENEKMINMSIIAFKCIECKKNVGVYIYI